MDHAEAFTPIFILGAGRSGTTLLSKLLSLNPNVCFLSNYDNRLGKFAPAVYRAFSELSFDTKIHSWFSPSGNAYHRKRPLHKKVIPTPDEGVLFFKSCGFEDSICQLSQTSSISRMKIHRRLEAISKAHNKKWLVVKRTAFNRKIPLLKSIFPSAKYIVLVRDGRDVTYSLLDVEWWKNHTLWWSDKSPSQMQIEGHDPIELGAKNWQLEMNEIEVGLNSLEPQQYHTLSYENLIENPKEQISNIFKFLSTPFDDDVLAQLDKIGLSQNSKWRRHWSPQQAQKVINTQKNLLLKYGYLLN